jgi:hypothetical protein
MNSGPPRTLHTPTAKTRREARRRTTPTSDPATAERNRRKIAAAVSKSAATATDVAGKDAAGG